MELNLRQAVLQRVQGKELNELTEIISDSIGGVDQVLPGLGVLFEIIWQNSESKAQEQMVSVLKAQLQ